MENVDVEKQDAVLRQMSLTGEDKELADLFTKPGPDLEMAVWIAGDP